MKKNEEVMPFDEDEMDDWEEEIYHIDKKVAKKPVKKPVLVRQAKPLTAQEWIFQIFLAALPVFNISYLIYMAVGGKRKNKALVSWARASLVFVLLSYIFLFVISLKIVDFLKFYFFI